MLDMAMAMLKFNASDGHHFNDFQNVTDVKKCLSF